MRIELIGEDKKEIELFKNLSTAGTDEQELKMLYNAALSNYTANSLIAKINFLLQPRVCGIHLIFPPETVKKV